MTLNFFDAYTCIGPRTVNGHGSHPWSLQHLLDEMQHCSISGALVASTGQIVYNAMHENLRLSERLAKYDHLFPIWAAHPHWLDDFPSPDRLAQALAQHRVRAVLARPMPNGW